MLKPQCVSPSKPLVFERRKVFWMFCVLIQGFPFIPFPLCGLSHSYLRHSRHTFSTVRDGLCILGTDMALVHNTFSKPWFSPTAGIQGPNFGSIGNRWAIYWRGGRIRKNWIGRCVYFLAGFIWTKWNVWRIGFRACFMIEFMPISYLKITCVILWVVSPQLKIIIKY